MPSVRSGTTRGLVLSEASKLRAVLLAAVVVVLGAFGAGGWLSGRAADARSLAMSRERARSIASLVAAQSDLLLRSSDDAGVRRLMLDVQASGGVASCRVALSQLGVIASTDASEIGVMAVPERWGSGVAQVEHDRNSPVVEVGFEVPGRGSGNIEVQALPIESAMADTMLKSMVFGCVLSGLLLAGYARAVRGFRSLVSVGSALRSASNGERRAEALRVGEGFGGIAEAWNNMLDERDALEAQLADRAVLESVGQGAAEGASLPAACDAMAMGMLIIDPNREVMYANGAASVLLGLPRDSIDGGTVNTVFADENVREAIRVAFDEGIRAARIVEIARGENTKEPDAELRIIVRAIESSGGSLVSVLIEDITQQRLADRSRNAFVAQATHELRTPLTNIRLYVEQAIDEGDADPGVRAEALNVIGSESRRLERIVSDMLCVSEIEAGSLSIRVGSVRTDSLFADLEKDYKAQAEEKTIDLVFDLPPKMPAVAGDRDRIAQALHNLIGNALKYTPPGGTVEVRALMPESGGLSVEVRDTGIGIDPDECEQIFDRFYRANDRRIAHVTGSGLGLALAREIARLHGGDISVESAIDAGSTFIFGIPGAGADADDRPTNKAA